MNRFESDHSADRELERNRASNIVARPSFETGAIVDRRLRPEPSDATPQEAGGQYARIERRWEMRFLGAHIAWSKTMEAYSDRQARPLPGRSIDHHLLPPRPPGRGLSYAIGGALGVALAAAAAVAAFTSSPVARPTSVLVSLPPPIEIRHDKQAPALAPDKPYVAPAKAPARLPTPAARDPQIAVNDISLPTAPLAQRPVSPAASAVPLAERAAVREAVERAFKTGQTEAWAENGVEGFVVVGLPRDVEGRSCREIAVLERDGSFEGKTASSQKCVAKDGSLVSP